MTKTLKKISLIAVVTLSVLTFSCKEDQTNIINSEANSDQVETVSFCESESALFINLLKSGDNIDRVTFKNNFIPHIEILNNQDPVKYKMVNIISKKLTGEVNQEVFDLGFKNFKTELLKIY